MFEAFGFSERVMKEAYWVNEIAFWKPDDKRRAKIVRSGRIQDTEDGPQRVPPRDPEPGAGARFLSGRHARRADAARPGLFAPICWISRSRLPAAGNRNRLPGDRQARAARSRARRRGGDREGPRFVVGCDGARSAVRKALGLALHGDSANQAWGVMDVLAVTDFPDIRLKAAIQSAREGSVLIIPREGGYLVRLYIELDKLNENERVDKPEHHGGPADRSGAADPASLHAGGEGNRVVVGLRDRAAPLRQVRRRRRNRNRKTAARACSSPATLAIPIAPKPGRA